MVCHRRWDGVFVADNGSPVFHPLLHLDDSDLADLLQVIRGRVLGFFERRGSIESRHELTLCIELAIPPYRQVPNGGSSTKDTSN